MGDGFWCQEYESLESKGLSIFGRNQDAQRWTIFRYNNFVHNTLTVNNEMQRVVGYAPLTTSSTTPSFMHAVVDLTEVYKGSLAKAQRGVAIVDNSYIVVRDEVESMDKETTVRWTLLTPADVKITGDNQAELTEWKETSSTVQSPTRL